MQKIAPFLYSDMLLTEQLYPHLQEIDEAARNRMEWVQHMNMIKAQAEEFIFDELIYC